MKNKFLILFVALYFGLCSAQENSIDMCLTNDFERVKKNSKTNDSEYRTTRQTLVSIRTWPNGSKITVSFLDNPTPFVRAKIVRYAQEWEKYANIDFQFVSGKKGMIRIGLDEKDGYWSNIGRDAKLVSIDKKTMNFSGFKNDSKESHFSRKVLHEFGHALGLKHEHQSPSAGICWNWDAVIDYYKEIGDWSEKETRDNLEQLSKKDVGNYTAYDSKSIMLYPIDKELTDCNYEVGWNNQLSTFDKQGIANLYPKSESRNLKDNILEEYNWTAGWDNVQTFESDKNFLFLLKSKTGKVKILELGSNGTVGTKVYENKWTAGWTTAKTFKIRSQNYLLLLKKSTGDVKVFKLNNNGKVGSKVFEKKWTEGWTNAQVFRKGNQFYLFLLKEGTGDVHINKINNDGTIGAKTFDKKWTRGWSIAKAFTVNYTPHLFLFKSSTGDVHIHKLNSNGTIGSKVYDDKWSAGWTSGTTYAMNGQQYLMLLNSKNGRAVRWFITSGATIGASIADEKLRTGWTTNEPYRVGSKNFMLLLKERDGLVKTFSLK